jgi:glycosyltransferase involved in cell wall biosynthesis
LDLAEACPDLSFDVVGPQDGKDYSRDVCKRAKAIANVILHGPVLRRNVPEFYKKAAVVCCTSDFEGFPNTFLEAWSYGLPIVTTFDPDNLIIERGLGASAKDISELESGIRALLDSPQRWLKASRAARQYYLQNHTIKVAMPRFERVFLSVFGDDRLKPVPIGSG